MNGELTRGTDDAKDQTYFLWGIERAAIPRMLLPVGEMTKAETRALARELGFERRRRKGGESGNLLCARWRLREDPRGASRPADAPSLSPGADRLSDGTVVGEHDGFAHYTIGQRRGVPGGYDEPMFVTAIRAADRAVVIGPREELMGRGVIARGLNWLWIRRRRWAIVWACACVTVRRLSRRRSCASNAMR